MIFPVCVKQRAHKKQAFAHHYTSDFDICLLLAQLLLRGCVTLNRSILYYNITLHKVLFLRPTNVVYST